MSKQMNKYAWGHVTITVFGVCVAASTLVTSREIALKCGVALAVLVVTRKVGLWYNMWGGMVKRSVKEHNWSLALHWIFAMDVEGSNALGTQSNPLYIKLDHWDVTALVQRSKE